ncbi:MAG: dihydroorotase [Cyanobacteria bacterium M_surface_10_m2_119]|nr:dihydroorotase [Cyanobacteria bacterium M_surface_10_m2_119]
MAVPLWLHQVDLLAADGEPVQCTDALIDGQGRLEQWGPGVEERARALGLKPQPATGWLLAPCLVDPHSVLEEPWALQAETLTSLGLAAAAGGYGSLALLPWARPWRDRPERLQSLQRPGPLQLRLWGSFSLDGADEDLALHREQLAAGAIGLAGGTALPPLPLLERGLLLGAMEDRPVLLSPRSRSLTGGGFVRESVHTLRAGWPPDPVLSETLPLQSLLELALARPDRHLVLMNLSTAAAVHQLQSRRGQGQACPAATVSWWHLLADTASLSPTEEGWRVEPALGGPDDREALLHGLREGLITAVAVHHLPLDAEEQLLPLDQRRAGVAGHGAPHGLVLPALWQELVVKRRWSPAELWQVLCWGPATLLGEEAPQLERGSQRWLLFDPLASWTWERSDSLSRAANQPLLGRSMRGQVRATGLTVPANWSLPAPGSPPD